MKRLLIALLIVTSTIAATQAQPPMQADIAEKLDGKWLVEAQTVGERDEYKTMRRCERDDIWIFTAERVYELRTGDKTCQPDQETIAGTWELNADLNAIYLSVGGTFFRLEIIELTDDKLVVRQPWQETEMIITFKRAD